MGWHETVFEREAIYKEVWAEPVRNVAERYGISDVGLRKICQKLRVPTPALGYWSKVAAGKAPRAVPLPAKYDGPTAHIRRVYVDETAPERERRSAAALSENSPEVWPTFVVPESLQGCHELVGRTAKALGSRSTDPAKMLRSAGRGVFTVDVSQAQKDRALRILQACVTAFISAGARVVPSGADARCAHLKVIEQFVSFKLEELFDRTFREPTGKERAEQQRHSWFKPDLRVYAPSGKLKLTVLSDNEYAPYLSMRDGVDDRGPGWGHC